MNNPRLGPEAIHVVEEENTRLQYGMFSATEIQAQRAEETEELLCLGNQGKALQEASGSGVGLVQKGMGFAN